MSTYCDRCGEEGDTERCRICNAEFCTDCASSRELETGECANCLQRDCGHPGHSVMMDRPLSGKCPECGTYF